MAGFAIREARDSDVDGIAALSFAEEPAGSHDVEVFRRIWLWLHRANPSSKGKVLVGVDGADDNHVIGHYAIVPFRFRKRGEPLTTGGFLCRLLVAESSRNTMLFPQLEMRMLKGYADWGMGFAYGLINRPPVLKAHLYFKFKDVLALPVLARPVRAQKVINRVVRNKLLQIALQVLAPIGNAILSLLRRPSDRSVEIAQVERFTPDMAEPLDRITRTLPLAAERTVETLNWRFAELKDRDYKLFVARRSSQLAGYVVTRAMPMKELTSLAIVDILFASDDPAAGNALVNRALDEARDVSADVCACLLNPLGPYYGFFKKRWFLKTPEAFTLIVHEPPNAPHRLAEIPPAEWHLTWFDHDYV